MKKRIQQILLVCLLTAVVLSFSPSAAAYTLGEPYQKDLSNFITNEKYRDYVEMMVDYHVRTDADIRNALEGGFAAVFLFDGCSDNMNNPELSDLSYYRVSGVCIVLKLNAAGEPEMIYFNDNCSTIPDRPLEYGAWALPEIGDVGPATIFDGTYQLYSVRHKGEYEALHVRTDFRDATLDAVYMHPEGFTTSRASEINVHTRTSNHTSGRGMWSAGCPLVGDGDKWEFWKLIQAAYHTTYDTFEVGNFVGTLTIDRQHLRQELYTMYQNPNAVDTFLKNSRDIQPHTYLTRCSEETLYEETENRYTTMETQLMTLPCSNGTDARSVTLKTIPEGENVAITGSVRNSAGNKWFTVSYDGEDGYLFSGHTKPESWITRFKEFLFGN